MRPQLPALPLLHDDDSYVLDLAEVGTSCIRILRILRYPHNQNTSGEEYRFYDLDSETRRAVITQINRRYKGKTVIPT